MDETAGPLPPRLLAITAFAIAQVGRAGRAAMGRVMDEHGLGLWHFAVLAALDDTAPASQRELGTRLRIDPSDLVEVVGRLEGAGLVGRERDPSDRRRYVIEPTPEGRALLDELARRAADLDDRLLAPLDPEDRAAFERIVRVLLAHHDPRARNAPPEGAAATRTGPAAPG